MDPMIFGSDLTVRKQVIMRQKALDEIRSGRISDWQDLSDYILPRRLRYLVGDKKKVKRNTKIINPTATRAVRILQSGMMAGMTNPSRPWLRFVADKELMRNARVSRWLGDLGPKVLEAFNRSNVYKCLPKFYGDLAVFGTAAMYIEPDPVDVLRGFVLPMGQFWVANDPRGRVDTLYREFTMSVLNTIRKFGWDRTSERVKSLYRAKQFDQDVTIIHAVEPRYVYDPSKLDAVNMPWRSVWMEKDGPDTNGVLRESGFRRFPYLVARWEVTDDADDPYGDGPGLEAIGDAIGIQFIERRKAQAVDMITKPPMSGPSNLRPTAVSLVPGGYTGVDAISGGQEFKPAVLLREGVVKVFDDSTEVLKIRLNQTFFADLWLMLASTDRREITAREVDERHEEKMIQLGPVVDRLNDELIDPLCETTVNALIDREDYPPPPPELFGATVKVDNISIIGQAQKLVGAVGLERMAGFAGNISAVKPDVLDNVDTDQLIRNYADILGISPDNMTTRERMEAARQARAEQEQARAQAEAAPAARDMAQAGKVLSETDVNGDSALARLLGSVGAGSLQ